MVKSIKNAFSSLVATMMIVSSVGAGSLGFASAASAAMTGDLLKASGPAVYYYAADGKRYVFPNEKTYFSWYVDFSSVKTISDSELASISIGGNVTVRPGTKLVKIQTDPKVYAVTKCGVLHWVESETVAKSLYGDAWATRVIDVPDAFFVNYTIGSSIPTAVHPDGQTITYAGDSNNYVVWGGMKRKFADSSAWTANMLNSMNSVMTTISYQNGADVTGREAELADVVCAGTPVGGSLTVSLASDTPAGVTVPRNSASVPLAKYMFVGGSAGATITGLTLHRVGVGAAADLANIYLYDQNGKRLTTGRTINSTSHLATFSSLSIAVDAGASQAVYVYGDFNVASGSSGGQHSFEIMDAASVVVNAGTVSGSFPVRGNVFTVGTSLAGRLDVQKGTTPSNPTLGAADAEISNFKLTANTNDIKVNQVTLYQAGSISNSDLSNLKLYQGSTEVASAASVGSDGRIVLKFSTPYLISSGTTKVFSLHAKVGGRADRTIKTYVEYTTDVNATDMVYNAGAAVCIADTAIGGCTATGQGTFDGDSTDSNFITVTTQGGTLTNAFNGPATSNIAKGQLAVPLYKFSLTAESALEVRNVRFSIATSTGANACAVKGSASTNYFRSIKIKNLDTGATVMGPTEIASSVAASADTTGQITLSDAFPIAAGQTLNLAVVADIANSEDATGELYGNSDCGYKVTFQDFESNDIRLTDTGEFLSLTKVIPNQDVTGNQMNVKASSLTLSLAGSISSGTVVKKAQNVKVAGIVLTSGSQSGSLVTSITLTCQAELVSLGAAHGTAGALANCDQRITSLSLWDGATQVGIADAPDTTTGAAQISNMNYSVPAGATKILEIHASFSSTASTTAPYDQVSVGIAADSDVQAQDDSATSITVTRSAELDANADGASPSVEQTIRNSGVITYAAESNPNSTIVIAGQGVWVPFAQYKASAQFEDIELDRIAIHASSTAGYTFADNAAFSAVAVASGGSVLGQTVLSSGSTGTKDIDLSANKILVPMGSSKTFQLWAQISPVQASSSVAGATSGVSRSGMTPALGLKSGLVTGQWDANYYSSMNIQATGLGSGERVYASSTNATHGNHMVVRKTKPTVTKQTASTVLTDGDLDLMKFQVSSDAAGASYLKQVIFLLSKSSSTAGTSALTVGSFRLRKDGTEMNTASYAVNFASSTAAGQTVDVEASSIGSAQNVGYVVVSFTNEESITGSGSTYTLHATVSNSVSGQSISTSFYRDPNATITTGYIAATGAFSVFASSADIYHIATGAAPGSAAATGTFLWSDGSENPHSSALGASGGSRDWTNDVFLQDVTVSHILSN